MKDLLLGNGLWEQRRYNARLQPTQIGLGTGKTAAGTALSTDRAGLLLLDYSYGTASNNGNVLSQRIRAGTLNQIQRYTYDSLNRLKTAKETGSGALWSQTYAYDRYGNRRVTPDTDRVNSYLPRPVLTPQITVDIDTGTNRLAGTKGVNTIGYDPAGNLKADWAGNTFTYDGDNRLVAFNTTGTDSDTTYSYDGEGRRVQKAVGGSGGVTTTYVYNVLGQLVAEFGGTAPDRPGTRYLTSDHLGSTRVVTGEDQSVLSRHDYLPFGEEIEVSRGNRSAVSGYTASLADGPAQKFTGKERDNESGLDYFGARYFSGAGGRFTSADAPFADQGAADPQSWNLYSYTRNNPLVRVDPNGRFVFTLAAIAAALYVAADIVSTGVDVYTLYDTVQDPEATTGDVLLATGAVGVGLLAPGPGQAYVQGAKQGAKLVSKAAGRAGKAGAGAKATKPVAPKGRSTAERGRNKRGGGDRSRGNRMNLDDNKLDQANDIDHAKTVTRKRKRGDTIYSSTKSKQALKHELEKNKNNPEALRRMHHQE